MAGYIGSTPVPQGIQEQQSFTVTNSSGQTTFNTLGYTDGNTIRVTLNGVLLEGGGVDYTATNGSDIVLTTAASLDDVLTFETFNEFQLVSQTINSPTIKSNVTLKNDTEQDTDGGRASKIIYQGEQSGGEISTLAEIQASHDGTADDEKADLIFRTNDGSDGSSPTYAAKIDSGQNFLIGTIGVDPHNASSASDAGVAVRSDGRILAGVNQDNPAVFNRIGNDGDIAAFKKDGTTVGSIGTPYAGELYIQGTGANSSGLLFTSGNTIQPRKNSAADDGNIDLGASGNKFKDLYLDGGAYIGGTVAANKLDDYEEGNGNSSVTGSGGGTATTSGFASFYTKIGRLVHFQFEFRVTSISGCSGALQVALPFSSVDYAAGALRLYNATFTGAPFCATGASSSQLIFRASVSNAITNDILSTDYYHGAISYITNA